MTTCNIHGEALEEDTSGNRPVTHTVKTRESDKVIAEVYGVKLEALGKANPGKDIDDLTKGQMLTIPDNQERSNGWIWPLIVGLILIFILFKRKRKIICMPNPHELKHHRAARIKR